MEKSTSEKLVVIQLVKLSPTFMENEGPASGPHPEPDESSAHPSTLFP